MFSKTMRNTNFGIVFFSTGQESFASLKGENVQVNRKLH